MCHFSLFILELVGVEIDEQATSAVDLGDGLSYVTTYMPENCAYRAEVNDIIHYHYVGRLGETGKVFGRRYKNVI